MIIPIELGADSYNIWLERGALAKADTFFKLDRKVLIVTDSGVPAQYAETVAALCKDAYIEVFLQGEAQKNMDTYQAILSRLVQEGFSRSDCVVAVGGGVTGDMAGFAAASYMRGIDFYNVPTTVLSQVDSSIGGKVAIDFKGYKNIVGAFYQPKGVLIDPEVLKTLPPRQIANGLAEAVKMAATCDQGLFEELETKDPLLFIDQVIEGSLRIKKSVVEQDAKETGLRKVLNFGHTVGHAIESVSGLSELYHGECVSLGMLIMAAPEARARLVKVLERIGLPTEYAFDREQVISAMSMDKKVSGDKITVVTLPEIGRFEFETQTLEALNQKMREVL